VIDWIEPEWPYGDRLRVCTTTRRGGGSGGVYAGFNLATHVGDAAAAVAANRRHLDLLLGGLPIQWLEQVHGTQVIRADPRTAREVPVADGAWTSEKALVLAVLTADCLPVVLADRDFSCVAVVHAGWRGLVGGVLEAGCRALPVPPAVAWLGPAIGPEAYEVGRDVLGAVDALPIAGDGLTRRMHGSEKGYLDLFALAARLLSAEGVAEVYSERRCTFTDTGFYSYRRDGQTGRMVTLAWLPDDR
jgi:YfiH family protein